MRPQKPNGLSCEAPPSPIATPLRALLAASACIGASIAIGAASAHAALPAPAQPPELQGLEQRMSELTVTSQRFTGKETIGGRLPHKLAALRGLSSEVSGEESIAPAFNNVTLKFAGTTLTLLQIGSTLYTHDPAIARHDGGRPWVREDLTGKDRQFGSRPALGGPGIGAAGGPSPTPFKSDAALFKAGSDVRPLGAATVDGQATVGFAGTITARGLSETALSKKQIARLRRKHVKVSASFEAFIAPNGVPVHTKIVLSLGKLRVTASSDVLAIDFPVTVPAPPPAAETISAAELERIELARIKRALHKRHS